MFLKTLTLKGFKSFADPTTIELEPGITVVVGPNGSGKSNVVDAVAWVLGAQGPKVVRSTKMDDVIFAGTSRRPALGRAEVSLTIDNASRRLPVEVAEVTITRTLFRTGESEYALNGAPCRLLDIQELLSDAGVGRQQHVIVSQGPSSSAAAARGLSAASNPANRTSFGCRTCSERCGDSCGRSSVRPRRPAGTMGSSPSCGRSGCI